MYKINSFDIDMRFFVLTLMLRLLFFTSEISAQIVKEQIQKLDTISIQSNLKDSRVLNLSNPFTVPIGGGSELILTEGNSNLTLPMSNQSQPFAQKLGRWIFAKIPGAIIYDMDGTGNQINLAVRGLDPHRSWEFNIRQNGVIINSDLYGYPASHYSLPMESISRIEHVSGSAALQYGAEFGGLLNYVTKDMDTFKRIRLELIQTYSSFKTYSIYQSISLKKKYWSFHIYGNFRRSHGYRENGESKASSGYASIRYSPNSNFKSLFSVSKNYYQTQLPGPLTDSMFKLNPRMSTRSRNYFSPNLFLTSISCYWIPNDVSRMSLTISGLFGFRNSVQREGTALEADTLLGGGYPNRFVDIDHFNSRTGEWRFLRIGKLLNYSTTMSIGVRYFNNFLQRNQRGICETDFGPVFQVKNNFFPRDISLHSKSIAGSIQYSIELNKGFVLSPGIRYEKGISRVTGRISYLDTGFIPPLISYNLPAFGVTMVKILKDNIKIYGGISQGNRPLVFKDIIPSNSYEKIDNHLLGSTGYTVELGINNWRNKHSKISYMVNLYELSISNKLGSVIESYNNQVYVVKKNIGNTLTKGIECLLELEVFNKRSFRFSIFESIAIQKGIYTKGNVVVSGKNYNIKGNLLEGVPGVISRSGIELRIKQFEFRSLYSFVSKTYADPINTDIPNITGSIGVVNSYGLWDFQITHRIKSQVYITAAVNNALNLSYYTKRPTMYPGPGIWPSDPRSFSIVLKYLID